MSEAFGDSHQSRDLFQLSSSHFSFFDSLLVFNKHPFPNTPPVAHLPTHLTMPVAVFDTRHRPLREFIQGTEITRPRDLACKLPLRTAKKRNTPMLQKYLIVLLFFLLLEVSLKMRHRRTPAAEASAVQWLTSITQSFQKPQSFSGAKAHARDSLSSQATRVRSSSGT